MQTSIDHSFHMFRKHVLFQTHEDAKILQQFASLHSISKLCCNRMSLMNAQNIFVSHGPRRSCTSGPALGKCTGMRDSQRPGTKNKLLDFRSLSLSPLKQVYLAIINHLQKLKEKHAHRMSRLWT